MESEGTGPLPDGWLAARGKMIDDWETVGKWPEALRNVICSMMPKPKADTEAGQGPRRVYPTSIGVDGHPKRVSARNGH